jgi:hypothetical protein
LEGVQVYDRGKTFVGIAAFVVVVLSPIWYNAMTGQASYVPDLKLPVNERQCVESAAFMRANHTELLNRWKETVVRTGERAYRAGDGRTYTMSLVGTCMKCHSSKAEFCDRCHNYADVQPQCWDCHVAPKKVEREAMAQ